MAVSEFLPFATMATANVVAQADYALDPSTGNGFTAGIALSAKLNKVWRQASFVGAGLAQFMMERTNADVVDDGDLDKFVQQLYDSFVVTMTGTGDTRWVNITGDTMTGPLVLSADPINLLDAVTKQYVDNGFAYIGGILQTGYLPLAGGVMTGPITLNANPTQPLQPATKAYVDQVFGGSGSALDPRYVNVAGDTMQGYLNVIDPVADSSATNKGYVDYLFFYLADQFQWYLPISGGQMYGPLLLYSNTPTQSNEAVTAEYVQQYVAGAVGGGGAYLPLTGGTLEGPGNFVTRGWAIFDSGVYFRPTAFPGFTQSVLMEGTAAINALETNTFHCWGTGENDGAFSVYGLLGCGGGFYVNPTLIPGYNVGFICDAPGYFSAHLDVWATFSASGVITSQGGLAALGVFTGSNYGFISDQDSYFRKGVEVVGQLTAYGNAYVAGGILVDNNIIAYAGLYVGGVYPGLNYALYCAGNIYALAQVDVAGTITVGTDLYVAGIAQFSHQTAHGMGMWIGGLYPGYNYTLMVSGLSEFQTGIHVYDHVWCAGDIYCNGGMAASYLSVSGMITCSAFDVIGNDSTISGNLYVGNICTVANTLWAPTILADYELWVGTKINTANYFLAGIQFAANGGSYVQIYNPSGYASVTFYSSGENYYSNATHVFTNAAANVGWAQFQNSVTYNVSGVWVQYSGAEIKRDIEPYQRGLEAIRQIQPVSFKYTEDMPLGDDEGRTRYGLVAQDIEQIAPEMVGREISRDREFATVAPGHLVYLLTNAVKELADRLDSLERRLIDDARTTQRTERPRSGK